MMTYYWDADHAYGSFKANSDQDAIESTRDWENLLILYRENDKTKNGHPFVTLIHSKKP